MTRTTIGTVSSGQTIASATMNGLIGNDSDHETRIISNTTAISSSAPKLTPTSVKTAAYTAVAGDLVVVSTVSGSVAITLPATTSSVTAVSVKVVSGTLINGTMNLVNSVTVACAGSDVFNASGGNTTLTLSVLRQGNVLIGLNGIWTVQDSLPLTSLQTIAPKTVAPSDLSFAAWAFDPILVATNAAITSGVLYLTRMSVTAGTITNIITSVGVAGSGLTSGQNFCGLYSSTGTLLSATADQTTNWTTANSIQTIPLTTAQTVSMGYVYVGFLSVGTTIPQFGRASAAQGSSLMQGLSASSLPRMASYGSGLTALPATITMTNTLASSNVPWAALS